MMIIITFTKCHFIFYWHNCDRLDKNYDILEKNVNLFINLLKISNWIRIWLFQSLIFSIISKDVFAQIDDKAKTQIK